MKKSMMVGLLLCGVLLSSFAWDYKSIINSVKESPLSTGVGCMAITVVGYHLFTWCFDKAKPQAEKKVEAPVEEKDKKNLSTKPYLGEVDAEQRARYDKVVKQYSKLRPSIPTQSEHELVYPSSFKEAAQQINHKS